MYFCHERRYERKLRMYDSIVCICIHACLRGYADHPEDERLHHTITRTDERFDLWRFIIILPSYLRMFATVRQASKKQNHLTVRRVDTLIVY